MCAVNPKWAKFIFHWSCASDPVDGAHDTPPPDTRIDWGGMYPQYTQTALTAPRSIVGLPVLMSDQRYRGFG